MKRITLLGASGSIGAQALDVISRYPGRFNLIAISIHANYQFVIDHYQQLKNVKYIVVTKMEAYQILKERYPQQVLFGLANLQKIATLDEVNYVINALVGFVGLLPTIKAIEAKKDIGLANKETLVAAGELVMKKARENRVNIYPIDSEHSAIYQCLLGETSFEKIILTASGGPFRNLSRGELANVTLEQALKHPNWSMGAKISIDSATMVNKGLEIIEAFHLFNSKQIEVLIHPQSIVHSMVQFSDGGIKAQLGTPDMRLPIMFALSAPQRLLLEDIKRIDFTSLHQLDFQIPDFKRFPALSLAYRVINEGKSSGIVFNASAEIAVEQFIKGQLPFNKIEEVIEQTMNAIPLINVEDMETIIAIDAQSRQYAISLIEKGI